MAQVGTGGAKTGGPRVKVKATPKAKAKVTPTPDQADRNTKPRTAPPAVKVRAYAHPYRKEPQKVIQGVIAQQDEAKARRAETKAVVHTIHVTPVPSPDATDSTRSPAQQAHDRAFTQQSGQQAHLRAIRKEHRGAGTRLVVHVVSQGEKTAGDVISHLPQTKQEKQVHKQAAGRPDGGAPVFAMITSRVAANTPGLKEIAATSPTGAKFVGNVAADAAEIGVTTPSSVAKLASTAVHDPKKVPGLLVEPYKQLAHDPAKFAFERPLTTALMLDPAARMPGRVLGKAARITGKQTLERPAATLPETALKERRTGSRDFFVRKVQERADRKNSAPIVTAEEVQRRVDEHFDAAKHEARRIEAEAVRTARRAARGQPKNVRRDAIAQAREDARQTAHDVAQERFGREFGAVREVSPQGHVVMPKNPTEGALHATRDQARKVSGRLNTRGQPATFVVRPAGPGKWTVVPKVAAERLRKQRVVGTSPATMAKAMRVSRGAFTNAVLPLSPKWLAGQGVEAGIRSAAAGAGPMDWLRMGKVVKRLNAQRAGAGDELMDRVTGGHFDLTGPARDFANGKSLAEEFEGTSLARPTRAVSAAARTAPARAVRAGWSQYTRAVLGTVNHTIEANARRAMAGQAVKNLGFADRHINGLSDAAIHDAANGLRGTHNQVALGRAVDRMYGQYQKFSPEMRSLLLHWSPFLPWYLNTVKFLTKVLPVDHPVQSALLVDAGAAEEEWRKHHGLSLRAGHVPGFLLGSYPVGKGDGFLRVAHYTPFGVGSDPTGAVGSLVLPQVVGPLGNAVFGVDWKGQPLTRGGSHGAKFNTGEKFIRATATALEEQIPGVSQAGAISGVTPRLVDKDNPESVKSPGTVLKGYLPWTPTSGGVTPSAAPSSSSGRVKVPGVGSGRIKVPGITGRIKVPGG